MPRPMTRRQLLRLAGAGAVAGAVAVAACSRHPLAGSAPPVSPSEPSVPTTAATSTRPDVTAPRPPPSDDLSPVAPGDVRVVERVERPAAAALTFHGGGDPALASRLIDVVAGTPITVFAIGQWLDDNPRLAKDMSLSPGVELENHTYTHPALAQLPASAIRREVADGRRAVTHVLGRSDLYFRPSGTTDATPDIVAAAATAGYRTIVVYDVDSADYTGIDAPTILDNVRAGLRAGSIVSLHFGYPATIDALPGLLQLFSDRGLAPMTVRDLLTR